MNEQREAIARSMTSGFSRRVWDGNFNPSPEPEYNKAVRDHVRSDYLNDADLVIAHLWQAADDDYGDAVTAAYQALEDQYDRNGKVDRVCAMAALTAGLEALIGPRPEEQEAE